MEFIAPDFWEEHCVECGAPMCYKTCEKYVHAPGGSCRRFARGIERCRIGNRDGMGVDFLPWGKLEMYWQGKMAKAKKVYLLRRLSGWLNNPIVLNILSRTICQGIWRRMSNLIGERGLMPDKWVICCNAESESELLAAGVDRENKTVFEKRLHIAKGSNEFEIRLPKMGCPMFFRLSSLNGSGGRIIFIKCEIGVDSTLKSAAKSPARYVKCVAWDLDNTLWKGILVNDGIEGITVRPEVVATIKKLDERGILNTICSKNDFEQAWKALDVLGLKEYFVFPRINWLPKSENLKQIAKDMNIGIDTFAFIDDSAHERGEVGENLGMVRVFDEKTGFLDRDEFNPPVSAESANRRQQYLVEMSRKKEEAEYDGNHEDFLRKCQVILTCNRIEDAQTLKRCWELVNRTNQLTLAAHRYSEEEFAALASRRHAYVIRCRDKYGDYGVVGFIAFEIDGGKALVSEFVMSCRIAKKLCEQSVLLHFATQFKELGQKVLTAKVVETGRNVALVDAFNAMPFANHKEPGCLIYELDLMANDWSGVYSNEVEILGVK